MRGVRAPVPFRDEASRGAARHRAPRGASHAADFSVGCHCEDEGRCHRSVLRELLSAEGAAIEDRRHGASRMR